MVNRRCTQYLPRSQFPRQDSVGMHTLKKAWQIKCGNKRPNSQMPENLYENPDDVQTKILKAPNQIENKKFVTPASARNHRGR